ncbi:MAG: DUF2807 domain-containing protein [Myxococcota bacterium]
MQRLALALLLCSGCSVVHGDGNLVDQPRSVGAFSKVSVSGGLPADIKVGAASVVVHIDQNLQAEVSATVEGDTLVIKRASPSRQISPSSGTIVRIASPRVEGIDLSGGSRTTALTSSVATLSLALSGGATLNASGIQSAQVNVDASGGSTAVLEGTATGLKISGSGGSHLTSRLPTADLVLDISGGTSVDAKASRSLHATASGGSHATVHGSPTEKVVEESGGSSVNVGE